MGFLGGGGGWTSNRSFSSPLAAVHWSKAILENVFRAQLSGHRGLEQSWRSVDTCGVRSTAWSLHPRPHCPPSGASSRLWGSRSLSGMCWPSFPGKAALPRVLLLVAWLLLCSGNMPSLRVLTEQQQTHEPWQSTQPTDHPLLLWASVTCTCWPYLSLAILPISSVGSLFWSSNSSLKLSPRSFSLFFPLFLDNFINSHGFNDHLFSKTSLVAQMIKNLPAVQGTCVWSLRWEEPPEKGMATHSSILACRIPWTEESGGL